MSVSNLLLKVLLTSPLSSRFLPAAIQLQLSVSVPTPNINNNNNSIILFTSLFSPDPSQRQSNFKILYLCLSVFQLLIILSHYPRPCFTPEIHSSFFLQAFRLLFFTSQLSPTALLQATRSHHQGHRLLNGGPIF